MTNGRQKQGDDCATALLAQRHRKPAASVAERARLPGKELAGPSGGRWLPYPVACPGPPPASRRPLLPSASGRSQATLCVPPQPLGGSGANSPSFAGPPGLIAPLGPRQVDPGGHTLLPAPDPLRDPPESLSGGHSLHPELPALGSHSPHAARALKVWIR